MLCEAVRNLPGFQPVDSSAISQLESSRPQTTLPDKLLSFKSLIQLSDNIDTNEEEEFVSLILGSHFLDTTEFFKAVETKRIAYNALKLEVDKIDGKKRSAESSDDDSSLSFFENIRRYGPVIDEEEWEARYEELKSYNDISHEPASPSRWQKNSGMSNWMRQQRALYKSDQLPIEKIELLEDIGFQWEIKAGTVQWAGLWDRRFEELKEYRDKYGDVHVPTRFKSNPTLSVWVRTQRSMRRRGILSDERTARLDTLGFKW